MNQAEQQERGQERRSGARLRLLPAVALAVLLVFAGMGGFFWWSFERLPAGKPEARLELRVEAGDGLARIARRLQDVEVLHRPRLFQAGARLYGLDTGLQLGRFELNGAMSCRELLDALHVYSVPGHFLTVPEGLRLREIAGRVAAKSHLDSLRFLELCRQPDWLEWQEGDALPDLQGWLFPDSYRVSEADREEDLIRRMLERGRQVVCELQPACDTLDWNRLLTLASIVQGEYQVASEADTIAGVYLNRLEKGMKLQADPTVQFLLPEPRRLLFRDLELDSPYNTYKVYGLPPGPINSPGRVALQAVLFPARMDYLYFVADGTGKHLFAKDAAGHAENRKVLDRLRRELRRRR